MSMFRNRRIAIVALSGLLMAGTTGAVLAQPVDFQQGQRGGGGVTLDMLTTRLKLTDDQQTKLKPILADRDTQNAAIRGDQTLAREDRMAKMMKVRTDTDGKINAILTDDQKAEYKKMNDEMRARMGGGGTPPAQ
jgi:hypothetical protein